MLVFNLPAHVVPEHAKVAVVGTRASEFVGTRKLAAETGAGQRILVASKRPISGSITLLAKGQTGDMLEDLPLSVLQVPEILKARDARPNPEIKVEVYAVEESPAEPSPPSAEEGAPDAPHVEHVPEEHPPASAPAHAAEPPHAAGKTE